MRAPTALLCLWALCALWALWLPGVAVAQAVQLGGVAGGRALLVIDGQPPRLVAPGQALGGVKLLSVSGDRAVVEVDGERLTLTLGQAPLQMGAGTGTGGEATGGSGRVVIEAGRGGHFTRSGQINGKHVEFMVDTGATVVALGRPDAERIGLKLDDSQRVQMGTANGVVVAHQARLASVRLGEATLYDVPAVVMPNPMPYVLLGNSFLSRFQMKRENTTLILEKRY